MISPSWPGAPGASADAAVPAAVTVDVAAAAAIRATVVAAVAAMGVATSAPVLSLPAWTTASAWAQAFLRSKSD